MKLFFSTIVGLILFGYVCATTTLTDIPSVKAQTVLKKPADLKLDLDDVERVNIALRLRNAQTRQTNWVNNVAARGGQITIVSSSRGALYPASKITAVLTPAMRRTGSGPTATIPDMATFQQTYNKGGARCHIIGSQLGGDGKVNANLFPGFQKSFNSPAMRGYENQVAAELGKGKTMNYSVELIYGTNFYPDAVKMEATFASTGARLFKVRIDNTPAAPVTILQ